MITLYLKPDPDTDAAMQQIRRAIRKKESIAIDADEILFLSVSLAILKGEIPIDAVNDSQLLPDHDL